jgi:hypothetical protein
MPFAGLTLMHSSTLFRAVSSHAAYSSALPPGPRRLGQAPRDESRSFVNVLFPVHACPHTAYILIFSGTARIRLGIPKEWSIVSSWLQNPPIFPTFPLHTSPSFAKKCPEIPPFRSYVLPPPPSFWEHFPSRPSSPAPESHVSADNPRVPPTLQQRQTPSVPLSERTPDRP